MNKALLTLHEASILFTLAEAWSKYRLLPDHPPNDVDDFERAIHTAQRIILARTGRRQLGRAAESYAPILPEIKVEDLKELAEQMKELTGKSLLSVRKATHAP